MALHFDYTKCKAPAGMPMSGLTTCPWDKERWHPVGDALVWLSLSCGFRTITEKNANDVYNRIALYQRLYGPYLILSKGEGQKPDGVYVTREDVQTYIGLSTNVTDEPFGKWVKRITESWLRDYASRDANEQGASAFEIAERHRDPATFETEEA